MKKFLAIALSALLVVSMAVPAMAADYTSREQDTDPHVKQQEYEGESVDFIIYDEDGNVIEGQEYSEDGKELIIRDDEGNVKATYEVVIYSYASMMAGAVIPDEIAALLTAAYASYQAGAYDSVAGNKILQSIVYIGLKKTSYDAAGSVTGVDYVGATDIEGCATFKVAFNDSYALAINAEGDPLTESYVKLGDPGIFFLFKEQGTGGGGGKSPQTGYESNTGIVVAVSLVAALVAVVGGCYVADKKRA